MAGRHAQSQPTWTDVKSRLASFDRAGLLSLVHDLYAANKDNQAFLHARFGLGEDVLNPYKKTLGRWLWPDVFRKQDTSVVRAKQAISNYKKAVGEASGLAELMVTYCELAVGYSRAIVHDDESYFDALVLMFEQALKVASTLPDSGRNALYGRLDQIRSTSQAFGYGVGDDMDSLFAKYAKAKHDPFFSATPIDIPMLRLSGEWTVEMPPCGATLSVTESKDGDSSTKVQWATKIRYHGPQLRYPTDLVGPYGKMWLEKDVHSQMGSIRLALDQVVASHEGTGSGLHR